MMRGMRVRKVTLAALIGWLAGLAATFPLQLAEVLRNTNGDWKLMVASLGLGLMIWAMWTLGMAVTGWIVAGLPVALFAKPPLLLQRRTTATVVSGILGLAVVAVKFRIWEMEWTGADYLAIRLYAVFLTTFAAATAWVYVGFLRRANRVRITVPA